MDSHMDSHMDHFPRSTAQGALRPSLASTMHPTYVPVTLLRDAAKHQRPVAVTSTLRINASEVDALFGHWIVHAANQPRYDVFVSYRWGTHDSPLTAMLVDHLDWYTVGEAHPRPLVAFLDRRSLELGKDFQESFVEALTRSTVVVPIVSHAALDRMVKHDPNAEDNVLVEWLCALFLLRHRGQLHSLLPVFVGARGGVDSGGALDRHGLGKNFFAPVAEYNNQSILQALPDTVPTATLRKAVELLQKTGMWPAHAAKEAAHVDAPQVRSYIAPI